MVQLTIHISIKEITSLSQWNAWKLHQLYNMHLSHADKNKMN